MKLARRMSLNLMARADVSSFRTHQEFDPASAVVLELQRINGDLQASERLNPIWAVIDDAVKSLTFSELIPFCDSHAVHDRLNGAIDPFLSKLLFVQNPKTSVFRAPPIHGRSVRADSPRKSLAAAGEFARRELGDLPDNLGRLAPTELLLLHESFRDGGARSVIQSDGFRSLFLLRASQSGLLQRFQHDTESAHTEPVVCIQIELVDDPNDHRLSDPSHPPHISYYRAVVVHLFHQWARTANELRWSLQAIFVHNASNSKSRVVLEPREVQDLGESTVKTFDRLSSTCPSAFVAARSQPTSRQIQLPQLAVEFDLAIRIVVGPESDSRDDRLLWNGVQTKDEIGIRTERGPKGEWGFSILDKCGSAPSRRIEDFSCDTDDPAAIASEIIVATLGLESQPLDLEIA